MANLELQQEWERRVTAFLASGLSGAKWCEANSCKEHQLWYWVRKFREVGAEKAAPTQWLQLEAAESATSGLRIRVGPATVEVEQGFAPRLLVEVVRALSSLC